MNKIVQQENNTLAITQQNDFYLFLNVSQYDADTESWISKDLSTAQDLHVALVKANGQRIELDPEWDNGQLKAFVKASYLQQACYGVQISWREDSRHRFTYTPGLLSIVKTSPEASLSTLDYTSPDQSINIQIKSDVATVIVGKAADDYYTKDEVYTKDETNTMLLSYTTTIELTDTLLSYVKTQVLNDTLASYVKVNDLNNTLISYVDKNDLDTVLASYVNDDELATTLQSYVDYTTFDRTREEMVTDTQLNTTLTSYVKTDDLNNTLSSYISGDDLSYTLSSYVKTSDMNTTLTAYVTTGVYDDNTKNIYLKHGDTVLATIDASSFVMDGMIESVYVYNGNLIITFNTESGHENIVIPISDIFDANNYYSKSEVDTILTSYVTGNQLGIILESYTKGTDLDNLLVSYVTKIDLDNTLSSYVTNSTLNTTLSSYATHDYLSSQSYATQAYVQDKINNIPTSHGDVTYEYLSSQSYITNNYLSSQSYVASQDTRDIVFLTQSEYDTLSNNNQLSQDTMYCITDATSNYVTYSYIETQMSSLNQLYPSYSYVDNRYTTYSYVDEKIASIPMAQLFNADGSYTQITYIWAGTNEQLSYITNKRSDTLYITTDDTTPQVDLTYYATKQDVIDAVPKIVHTTYANYTYLLAYNGIDHNTIYFIDQ